MRARIIQIFELRHVAKPPGTDPGINHNAKDNRHQQYNPKYQNVFSEFFVCKFHVATI
jgi:hypothetical protein